MSKVRSGNVINKYGEQIEREKKQQMKKFNVIKIYKTKKGGRKYLNKKEINPSHPCQKERCSNIIKLPKMDNLLILTHQRKNLDLELKNTRKTLSHCFTALDSYLSSSENLKDLELNDYILREINAQNEGKNTELRKFYESFLKRLVEIGELDDHILCYAWCLNKKAVQRLKNSSKSNFEKSENLLLFSSCVYLSIKILEDKVKWFIEDFSFISGFDQKVIEKMETNLIKNIFNYEYFVNSDLYEIERFFLKAKIEEKYLQKRFKIKRIRYSSSFVGKGNLGVKEIGIHQRKMSCGNKREG